MPFQHLQRPCLSSRGHLQPGESSAASAATKREEGGEHPHLMGSCRKSAHFPGRGSDGGHGPGYAYAVLLLLVTPSPPRPAPTPRLLQTRLPTPPTPVILHVNIPLSPLLPPLAPSLGPAGHGLGKVPLDRFAYGGGRDVARSLFSITSVSPFAFYSHVP